MLQGAETDDMRYERRNWSSIVNLISTRPAKVGRLSLIERTTVSQPWCVHLSDKLAFYKKESITMTREENAKKLVELRASAEKLVSSYNEAMQTGKVDEAFKIDSSLTETTNEYTAIVRGMCFEDCKNSPNPMIAAVTALTFTTIGVKDEKKGDDKIAVRSIVEKERPIDLYKLHKYCGGIGADKNWVYMTEKMNCLLTAQKAVDLGIDPKDVNDSFAMSAIAKEIDMGKSPCSKTNLLKTLQVVIAAMLGEEFKATSHDVNFLMSVYSRKSRKARTVTCANNKYFRNYLAEICHRIVTSKGYAVEFKAEKAQ